MPCILCPVCNLEEEKLVHLFVRCEVAPRNWNAIFKWLETHLIPFDYITQLFKQVDSLCGTVNKRRVIDVVYYPTVWFLWQFRNDKVFGGGRLENILFLFY